MTLFSTWEILLSFTISFIVFYGDMSDLFTTQNAAEYLGVTPARVRQLIVEGRLKSRKIGRDHVIEQSDLEQYAINGKMKRGRPSKKYLRKR